MIAKNTWYPGAALLLFSSMGHAGCGASVCSINTNWNVQGVWTEPGGRIDLRYEFIDQDQPRRGTDRVAVGEISQHHDEVRTINRNWLATVDYAFTPNWGISGSLPILDRSHSHIHHHRGAQILDRWNYTEVGDVRVLGRYQFTPQAFSQKTMGINFGVKLPTGKTDEKNGESQLAERTLQPGSGTTDLLLGGYYNWASADAKNNWFMQGLVQLPLNTHDNFKPGSQLSLDVGLRRAWTDRLAVLLQLNTNIKRRDKGSEAEPEDSGSTTLSLSPGLSYALTASTQVYGFVQVPVYTHVNGIQLTSNWAVVAGINSRF